MLKPSYNKEELDEKRSLYENWQRKFRIAQGNTKKCKNRSGVLIEIAAQHPLVDGEFPNKEFAERLDFGLSLYRKMRLTEKNVKIYVPGSVHMDEGKADRLSLSRSGCNYLQTKGVNITDLIGEEANTEFKGDLGVYNSSDECYVATRLFDKLGYGELHCVCSPAQLLRKALSYIEFGLVPKMHSVPLEEMFHNYIDEAFLYIPRLLKDESGLQGDSVEAKRLRVLRKPKHQ